VSLLGATMLATLSKANGILLPMLAAVLEACIFSQYAIVSEHALRKLRSVLAAVLGIPILIVSAYLLRPLLSLGVTPTNRAWTIGERILTEPRVLMDYLQLLAVPRSISTGLFNDAYPVSHGLLDPWTTLPSIVALLGIFAISLWCRKRVPELSCALLFFLAGHALESTTLPLELYFEHRNYLPAMMLFWPLASLIARWRAPVSIRIFAALAVLALFALTTYQRASLWGQPQVLARIWAVSNPGSARAQTVAAIAEQRSEGPAASLSRLLPLWEQHPLELQFAFNVVDARCATGGIPSSEKKAVATTLASASRLDLMTHVWLANAIEVARTESCGDLGLGDVSAWVDAALQNPVVAKGGHRDQDFEPLLGMLALYRGKATPALQHFDRALKAYPNPDQAARQAVLLASNGFYDQALSHLATYQEMGAPMPSTGFDMSRLHHKVLQWQGYWPRELRLLVAKIEAEKSKEQLH
jgi:protein O-mannosyl-transferase